MKDFLKENKTIICGLSLPVVCIVVFFLYAFISNILIEEPKYNVIYATTNYNNNIKISVVNEEVKVKIFDNENINNVNVSRNGDLMESLSLWFFNSKTKETKEIYLNINQKTKNNETNDNDYISYVYNVDIPELKDVKVNKSSISPDGYKIDKETRRSRGALSGLFYDYSNKSKITLVKGQKSILIKEDSYYSQNSVKIIGWTESVL